MTTMVTPERQLPPTVRRSYGHFIDGRWVEGSSGETIALLNPATGEVLADIAAGGPVDVDRAITAAEKAFRTWAYTSPAERQEVLWEMGKRIERNAHEYAMLDTLNHGPTINETSGFFVPIAIEQFKMFAGIPWNHSGSTQYSPHRLGLVHREPLGVCAQIIPWNAPLLMFAAKVAPALAAGNTVVVKPSEIACLSVMAFLDDIADLVPPGVINVVTGYGSAVGESLVTDTRVRKVAFTGSRPTARRLLEYSAVNIIPQTMELGGKSANIVCPDADLDQAAEGVAMTMIANKGEFCLAGSRVFLHDDVYDDFIERLHANIAKISMGDPTARGTNLGPLASKAQLDKVTSYIQLGQEEGATLLTGGGSGLEAFPEGNFVQPTVFTDVDNSMRIAQEEIFGPVSCVLRWSDEDEMVRQANQVEYGLGGGVWTRDLTRAHRVARRLETGTVWVNQYYNWMENMPVGGFKQSGFGREFSHEAIEQYTQTKSVIVNLQSGPMGLFG